MSNVLVESREGIAVFTLNRPEKYNAFDPPFIREVRSTFEATIRKPDVSAVIITGAGKAFCAGGDVTAMRAALDRDPARLFQDLTEHFHPMIAAIRKTPKPIVAALNGPAAGGGVGLALACDLRIASEAASFKPGYRRLGIVPDGGITYLLPRMAGYSVAQRIILRDETVTVQEAARLGLVDRVVPAEQLLPAALEEAGRLAAQPPESFRLTKELLNLSALPNLEAHLDRERRRIAASAKGPWLREGVTAFLEKREPDFRTKRR